MEPLLLNPSALLFQAKTRRLLHRNTGLYQYKHEISTLLAYFHYQYLKSIAYNFRDLPDLTPRRRF
jgi:hypothetical protein